MKRFTRILAATLALSSASSFAELGSETWGSMVWGQTSANVPMMGSIGQVVFFTALLLIGVLASKRWGIAKVLPLLALTTTLPLMLEAQANGRDMMPNYYTVNGCQLSPHAQCAGADLSNHEMLNAFAINANLGGTNLSHSNLSGANLSGVNFKGAYLNHTDLSGADLTHADFTGAYLYTAILDGANLTGANLTGAFINNDMHVFNNGDVADADDINNNFHNLSQRIDNIQLTPGPQGVAGPKGDQGDQGDQGAKGDEGPPAILPSCFEGQTFVFTADGIVCADFPTTDILTQDPNSTNDLPEVPMIIPNIGDNFDS